MRRNLAAILAETDPRAEPARMQPGVVDGRAVTVQCVLERTAVIVDGDLLRLVRLTDVDVDQDLLLWAPRVGLSQLELGVAAKRARAWISRQAP